MKPEAICFLVALAWRDLRAGSRSLWIFSGCLMLGVTLVVASAGMYGLIRDALLADTRSLLGGDLEVDAEAPLGENVLAWMRERGEVTLVTELDSMLGTPDGHFLRVELQAMEPNYPLYGEFALDPAVELVDATTYRDGHWGVAVDPLLAEQVGLEIGTMVWVGELAMPVRAFVLQQSDRSLAAEWRGAPVLLAPDALRAAGLLQPGSRVDYDYKVRTELPVDRWRAQFYAAFPATEGDVRSFEDRGRRIAERLTQLGSALMILSFSTLFIGGLGVFNSVHHHLRGKLKTIATLRSIGLRNRPLAFVYLMQIGMLSTAASLAGAAFGLALAVSGSALVATEIPLATTAASLVPAAFGGLVFGLLTAFAFSLPAIGRALAVEPAVLFRTTGRLQAGVPRAWAAAAGVATGLLLLGVFLVLPNAYFALGFLSSLLVVLLVLDGLVRTLRRAARRLAGSSKLVRRFELRLAVANLYRPGAPLRTTLISLGSALTLIVACTLIVVSLLRAVNETIPEEAPSLVLYDILDGQIDEVTALGRELPGAARLETTPLVRARITAINGVPIDALDSLSPRQRREAAREEYDLGYFSSNIDNVTVVEGAWSPDDGADRPMLAMEDREAEQLGLAPGDTLTFSVAGRTFDVSTSAVFSQKGLQTRFWFEGFVSDGALDGLINRHVGALYSDDETAIEMQRRIGRLAPNIVTVRTAALLAAARDVLGKGMAGLILVGAIGLVASFLVLSSVLAAAQSRFLYDAAVLHSLGTRISLIRRSLTFEYALLAVVTGCSAVLLGTLLAIPFITVQLKLSAQGLVWVGAAVSVGISLLTLCTAALYLQRRLRPSPAFLLQQSI